MPVLDNLKNVKIGTTDISDIGDGTCTGAIDSLQDQLNVLTEFKVEDEILYIPNGAGGYLADDEMLILGTTTE